MSDSKIKVSVIIHQIINALKVQNQSENNSQKKKKFSCDFEIRVKKAKITEFKKVWDTSIK